MVHVTQAELKQLVRHYACGITEAKQRVVGEDCAQTHRPRMQDTFMTQITERRMAMDDLYPLPDENLPQ